MNRWRPLVPRGFSVQNNDRLLNIYSRFIFLIVQILSLSRVTVKIRLENSFFYSILGVADQNKKWAVTFPFIEIAIFPV